MKSLLLACSLVFLLAFPTVSLAAELGPPMATNKKTQFAVDLEAGLFSQADVVERGRSLTVNVSGLGSVNVSNLDWTYSLQRREVAVIPSYGVGNKATLYAHIGMAAFKGKDCEPICIDSDYALSYGGGVRWTFFERGPLRFGGVFQYVSYASRDAADISVTTGGLSGRYRNVTIEGNETSLSLGTTYKADFIEPYIALDAVWATYPVHYEFVGDYVASGKTYNASADYKNTAKRAQDKKTGQTDWGKVVGLQGGISLKPTPNLRTAKGEGGR